MSASTEADDSLPDIPDDDLTPKRLTDKQISSTGIRPHQVPTPLRKRLLLGNVLIKELRVAVDSNKKDIKVVRNVAAGKICRKYRCVRALGKSIKISRQRIAKTTVKSIDMKRKRRSDGVSDVVKSAVLSFFKRDDNSRAIPVKNDAKKVATGVKKQKRISNDYLKNLHLKFLSEEPNMKTSLLKKNNLEIRKLENNFFLSRLFF